ILSSSVVIIYLLFGHKITKQMVNFSKLSVQICRSTEIYYLFADIYFANLMIISNFASDKENNNIF
ncbi:hypothetical protein CIK97_06415, partial [Prevotella sp. P3-120]|uniref:hypothetical protein n=1 Tax=Prevotella sp. P3-120 TaxID=2024220 RepID=UPI000BC8D82B